MGELTSPKVVNAPSPLSTVATTPKILPPAIKTLKQEELAGSLSAQEKMMNTMADPTPIRITAD
jgi:hypothetical protein